MKQITTLLLLLVTLATQSAWAQKLSVESFIQDRRKVYGSTEARLDGTGEQYCALVLVQLPTLQGVTFDGEIVNPIEPRGGEYWVYMVAGSKYLRIKHPSVHPLEVTFADYGIASLQSKATYVLSINVPNMQLEIAEKDQRILELESILSQMSLAGERQKITQSKTELDITCSTPEADILIDKKLRSKNSHWSGSMAPGSYMVEARKEGYYPQQKSVSLIENQNLKVEIPALVQRTGMLDIAYNPANTEVYLDGQKLGTSPDLFRNIPVGSHQIELRMEGYQSVTQRVTIEEGKTASLSGRLEQNTAIAQNNVTASTSTNQSDAQSLYDEGEKYYYGRGVTKDYAMAVSYFKKAAEMGHAEAQNQLGWCYDCGYGVEKNYSEAAKWYRKAAEQENAGGQLNLGYCYYNGHGVETNYSEAIKWYRKAAEQGNAKAQNRLGRCYYDGRGIEKNYTEAVKWFRKAAEQGNVDGQNNLGWCYLNGQGIKKDEKEAIRWYSKSAERGNNDAKKVLKTIGI